MTRLAEKLRWKKERLERLTESKGHPSSEQEDQAFLRESGEYMDLCREVRAHEKRRATDFEGWFIAGPLGFVVAAWFVLLTLLVSVAAWWSWTSEELGFWFARWTYLVLSAGLLMETVRLVSRRLRAKSERVGLKTLNPDATEED